MPEKELKEPITTEQEDTDTGSEVNTSDTSPKMSRQSLIVLFSIIGLVLLGLLIGGGVWALSTIAQRVNTPNEAPYYAQSQRINVHSPFGYGTTEQTQVTDSSVTTTVYTYQTGVVVAVNSGNIVIAGNGKQTTIQTNSSTTYTNSQKPVVNDTVIVTGTTTNNTTTATNIAVAD